jgi:hypothetical protein
MTPFYRPLKRSFIRLNDLGGAVNKKTPPAAA